MIKANIEAKIQQLYQVLNANKQDKRRISNLVHSLQSQERIMDEQIKELEYQIQQLEEEINE